MKNTHPSENIIQQYTIDKSDCSSEIIDHIESCLHCKAAVENYRLLFSEINNIPSPGFDFDLSALVISHLPWSRPELSADRFIAGFLIIFICCCIGIPLILFWTYIQNMFSGISSIFIYSILLSASVILSIKLLDMYNKFQKQMRLINFN